MTQFVGVVGAVREREGRFRWGKGKGGERGQGGVAEGKENVPLVRGKGEGGKGWIGGNKGQVW